MLRHLPGPMLFALLLSPGCGQPAFGGCGADGKILLLWTVRGQPASATGCQGIAQLQLVLSPDACSGGLEISPIPCERDDVGWRYDGLPRGGATVSLVAKDSGGVEILHGSTHVTLAAELPPAPAPLDLE